MVVGGDYGVTIGNIYANFLLTNSTRSPNKTLMSSQQYNQGVNDIMSCTELSYKLLANRNFNVQENNNVVMYLTSRLHTQNHYEVKSLLINTDAYCKGIDSTGLGRDRYSTPVFINISILPCPPGFTLLEDTSECGCSAVLTYNGVECTIPWCKFFFMEQYTVVEYI